MRSEELAVLPMAERLARALEVFSRANAAKDRRLRREIEPMTEPVKLDVVVVVLVLFQREVVVLGVVVAGGGGAAGTERGGKEEAEEEDEG